MKDKDEELRVEIALIGVVLHDRILHHERLEGVVHAIHTEEVVTDGDAIRQGDVKVVHIGIDFTSRTALVLNFITGGVA